MKTGKQCKRNLLQRLINWQMIHWALPISLKNGWLDLTPEPTPKPKPVTEVLEHHQNQFKFKPTPANFAFAKIEGTMADGGITATLDGDGDQTHQELIVKFLPANGLDSSKVKVQIKHIAEKDFRDVGEFDSRMKSGDFKITYVEPTDGIQDTIIHFNASDVAKLIGGFRPFVSISPPHKDFGGYTVGMPGNGAFKYTTKKQQAATEKRDTTIRVFEGPTKVGAFWYVDLMVGSFGDIARIRLRRDETFDNTVVGGPTQMALMFVSYHVTQTLKDKAGNEELRLIGSSVHNLQGINLPLLVPEGKKFDDFKLVVRQQTPQFVEFDFVPRDSTVHKKSDSPTFTIAHSLAAYTAEEMGFVEVKVNPTKKKNIQQETEFNDPSLYSKAGIHVYVGNNASPESKSFHRVKGLMDYQVLEKDEKPGAYHYEKELEGRSARDSIGALQSQRLPASMNAELLAIDTLLNALLRKAVEMRLIKRETMDYWRYLSVHLLKMLGTPALRTAKNHTLALKLLRYFTEWYEHELKDTAFSLKSSKHLYQHDVLGNNYDDRHINVFESQFTGKELTQETDEYDVGKNVAKDNFGLRLPDSTATFTTKYQKNRRLKRPDKNDHGTYLTKVAITRQPDYNRLLNDLRNKKWEAAKKSYEAVRRGYFNWLSYQFEAKAASYLHFFSANQNYEKFEYYRSIAQAIRAKNSLREKLHRQKDEKNRHTLKKVKAVFYPSLDASKQDEKDKVLKKQSKIPRYPLDLYYYADFDKDRWYVINLTGKPFHDYVSFSEGHDPNHPKKGKAVMPPKALFQVLSNKNNLPRGYLYYQIPGGPGDRVLIESKYEAYEWVKAVGVGISLAAMVLPGVGLMGIAVSRALGIAGGILIGTAGGMSIYYAAQEDRLDDTTLLNGVVDIGASFLSVLGSLRNYDNIRKSLNLSDTVYVTLSAGASAADVTSLALTTVATLDLIKQLYDDHNIDNREQRGALAWEISYLLAQGLLTVMGVRGNIKTFKQNPVGVMDLSKSEVGLSLQGRTSIKKVSETGNVTAKRVSESTNKGNIKKVKESNSQVQYNDSFLRADEKKMIQSMFQADESVVYYTRMANGKIVQLYQGAKKGVFYRKAGERKAYMTKEIKDGKKQLYEARRNNVQVTPPVHQQEVSYSTQKFTHSDTKFPKNDKRLTNNQRKKINAWFEASTLEQTAVHYTRIKPKGGKKRMFVQVFGNEKDGWFVWIKGKRQFITHQVNQGRITIFTAKRFTKFSTNKIQAKLGVKEQHTEKPSVGHLFADGESEIMFVQLKNNNYRKVYKETPIGKRKVPTYNNEVYYYRTSKRKVNISNRLNNQELKLQTAKREGTYEGNPVKTDGLYGTQYFIRDGYVGLIPSVRKPYIHWKFKIENK